MKYLYQYECEKVNLSTQDELQQAIDGNRREGRRSSYGHYAEMVGVTPPPTTGNRSNSHHTPPLALISRSMNGHGQLQAGSSSGEEDNGNSMSSTPSHHNANALPAQQEALNLEVKAANNNNNINTSNGNSRVRDRDVLDSSTRVAMELASRKLMEEALSAPPTKRFMASDDERYLLAGGFPSAHIKISSRGQS